MVAVGAVLVFVATAGGFWLKHDRDARAAAASQEAAKTEGLVLADLDAAMQRVQVTDPEGARQAVRRAQDRLTGNAGEFEQRVRETETAVDMIGRLEGVLLLETFTAGKFENGPANVAYAAAFQGYGIDIMALPSEEAAERIKASPLREQLVAALDDWIFVKPRDDKQGRERLLTVARLADNDAWRQQLRDPVMHKNRAALEQLAKNPAASSQPPSILVHLGKYLAQAGAWQASVEVLQMAQRRYPSDFWVNYALGMSLAEQKPPRSAEAASNFRTAVALRPNSFIAHLGLARQLLLQGQSSEALSQLAPGR